MHNKSLDRSGYLKSTSFSFASNILISCYRIIRLTTYVKIMQAILLNPTSPALAGDLPGWWHQLTNLKKRIKIKFETLNLLDFTSWNFNPPPTKQSLINLPRPMVVVCLRWLYDGFPFFFGCQFWIDSYNRYCLPCLLFFLLGLRLSPFLATLLSLFFARALELRIFSFLRN